MDRHYPFRIWKHGLNIAVQVYPELYPCIDNLSDCGVSSQRGMRRLSFPYTEAQNNKANYDLGVAELGGADNEATDLKWAKKN